MTAILFGSISTLADTSELQREAFNAAFAEHGLDWEWGRDDYAAMLERSGGSDRVAQYAEARGEQVDADAVHATKSRLFQERLADADLGPRPGVLDVVRAAKDQGVRLGLVTTTSPDNVEALLAALGGDLPDDTFDVVVDTTAVEARKPDGAAYRHALDRLGETADGCVAIEDNVEGVRAAHDAGIACLAFPNANTEDHDFSSADGRATSLEIGALTGLTAA